ncbi:putative lipoprotein [Rhizobium sp. PP-CC-3A-592]|nr:putative lipoprotein [Rhizobium sp. PP-CC-3A-592]
MPRFTAAAALCLASATLMVLAGCKIIKTPTAEEAAEAASGGFNPERQATELWTPKVVPYLTSKAGPYAEVAALIASDPEAAAAKYGHKEKEGNAPWTYAAKISGTVIKAETTSRAGYLDTDIDGDGKADVRVQIGPVIKGTAIRDSLDFVSFNQFKNQIQWAEFGKAFNAHLNGQVLQALPRAGLEGKTIEAVGAYPLPAKGQLPLLTPVNLAIGG